MKTDNYTATPVATVESWTNELESERIAKDKADGIHSIPVKFRWPVKQISPKEIVVQVSIGNTGFFDIVFRPEARLSDKETGKAWVAGADAIVRALMIVED